jgi:hypothetical protein
MGRELRMHGRNGFDTQGAEIDVLYVRANERVAKVIAFLGSYIIWGTLGFLTAGLVLFGN